MHNICSEMQRPQCCERFRTLGEILSHPQSHSPSNTNDHIQRTARLSEVRQTDGAQVSRQADTYGAEPGRTAGGVRLQECGLVEGRRVSNLKSS
jgi:hypothetical protein